VVTKGRYLPQDSSEPICDVPPTFADGCKFMLACIISRSNIETGLIQGSDWAFLRELLTHCRRADEGLRPPDLIRVQHSTAPKSWRDEFMRLVATFGRDVYDQPRMEEMGHTTGKQPGQADWHKPPDHRPPGHREWH